jgi:hypothetical protein
MATLRKGQLREYADALPEYRDSLGETRKLGTILPSSGYRPLFRVGVPRVIPESQWVEFDLREELKGSGIKVKDQDGRGACNDHARTSAMEYARVIAGQPHVALNAWFGYAIMCRGVDRGSMIADALELSMRVGAPPEDAVPYGTIDPDLIPPDAYEQAKRFKLEVGERLMTFEEMGTSAQLRRPFNFSIRVGNNFDRLDADGCVGLSSGPGNHAIVGGVFMKRARNGEWIIGLQNSWTEGWGDGGFAAYRKAHIAKQSYFEAYNLESASTDPEWREHPPVAPAA